MHKSYDSNSSWPAFRGRFIPCHSSPFFAASNLMLCESVWKNYWVIKFYDDRQMHLIFLLETNLHTETSRLDVKWSITKVVEWEKSKSFCTIKPFSVFFHYAKTSRSRAIFIDLLNLPSHPPYHHHQCMQI